MVVVALIAFWAVKRVAREHASGLELAEALDATSVVITTPDGRIEYWSGGCQQLYGWSASEARGQHKYALLRSRSIVQLGERSRANRDEQQLIELSRDGREIAVLERSQIVKSPGRGAVCVLAITDITQRVAAIDALRQSEERLAIAAAVHELGVFEWDARSGKLHWSPGTEQRLGLIPGSLGDYESWKAQVEPEDVAEITRTMDEAVRERAGHFSFRYRFVQPNGGVRAVEGSSRAFYDADGSLMRTVGVILDVTERDAHDAEIRQREAQLRSMFDTLPDPMIVIDEEATVLQFSPAAAALWGYPAEQVVGRHAEMLVASEEHDRHLANLRQFKRTREGLKGRVFQATGITASGKRFPYEFRVGVARQGGCDLLMIFVRDLTDRVATEERFSDLSEEIAHVSRQSAMSEVAADLAHELNQPLSATSNFLAAARRMIERGQHDDERTSDLIRQASEQTQRAGEIIRRLRAFMARGEVEMRTESLERTVKDAVNLIMVGTSQFNTKVSYDLSTQTPLIFADRTQVQQVIVNILRNSLEALRSAGQEDRQVTISSQKLNDDLAEISISDNGPGVPAQVLEKIFSRFTTTKSGGGGMGIGLSISKRIIEAHGGTISAENKPEGGARFTFTLPTPEESTRYE